MTHEERAAYINAQATLLRVEMEGMLAENQHRINCGNSIAYGEEAFTALRIRYCFLEENPLIEFFHQ